MQQPLGLWSPVDTTCGLYLGLHPLQDSADRPKNRLSFVSDAMFATEAANWSLIGRVTEQWAKSELMNSQGTRKIRLGRFKGLSGLKILGNIRSDVESVRQRALHSVACEIKPISESERRNGGSPIESGRLRKGGPKGS